MKKSRTKRVSKLMVYVLVGLLSIGAPVYSAYALLIIGGSFLHGSIITLVNGSGAGNADKKPSEIKFSTTLLTASVRCQNNGNQSEQANGTPFNVTGTINGTIPITSTKVDQNGNFHISNTVSDADINSNITIPEGACKQNWSVVPGSVTLQSFSQNLKAFFCTDLTCTATTTVNPVDENTLLCTNVPGNINWSCVVTFDAGHALFVINSVSP